MNARSIRILRGLGRIGTDASARSATRRRWTVMWCSLACAWLLQKPTQCMEPSIEWAILTIVYLLSLPVCIVAQVLVLSSEVRSIWMWMAGARQDGASR